MELSNYLISWVVMYPGDLQPTYVGVIIYLLSSMDILADLNFPRLGPCRSFCWHRWVLQLPPAMMVKEVLRRS